MARRSDGTAPTGTLPKVRWGGQLTETNEAPQAFPGRISTSGQSHPRGFPQEAASELGGVPGAG